MGVVLSQHGPNVDGFVFWWIIGFTLFSLMSRLNDNEGYSDPDVRFPLLMSKIQITRPQEGPGWESLIGLPVKNRP